MYLAIYLSTYLPIYLSLSLCLSVYLPTCLSASLKKSYSATSSFFKVDNIKNAAILRDFLIFQRWQHQTRSNSPRLPQCLHVTTSKTKHFCETSIFFEVDNIKNEAILRDYLFFKLDNIQNEAILRDFFNFWTWQHQKQSNSARLPSKMESWLQRWRPRTNAFRDLSIPLV